MENLTKIFPLTNLLFWAKQHRRRCQNKNNGTSFGGGVHADFKKGLFIPFIIQKRKHSSPLLLYFEVFRHNLPQNYAIFKDLRTVFCIFFRKKPCHVTYCQKRNFMTTLKINSLFVLHAISRLLSFYYFFYPCYRTFCLLLIP